MKLFARLIHLFTLPLCVIAAKRYTKLGERRRVGGGGGQQVMPPAEKKENAFTFLSFALAGGISNEEAILSMSVIL